LVAATAGDAGRVHKTSPQTIGFDWQNPGRLFHISLATFHRQWRARVLSGSTAIRLRGFLFRDYRALLGRDPSDGLM
jgi:hypothetical protein